MAKSGEKSQIAERLRMEKHARRREVMHELIKIQRDNDRITVLARDLHGFLEIESNFTTWFRRMCEYGFEEAKDFVPFWKKVQEADQLLIIRLLLKWRKKSP